MTIPISDNLETEIQSDETMLRMIVSIDLGDDGVIRLAANTNHNIYFDNNVYESAQIKRSQIEQNTDGSLEKITLTLSNNNRDWAAILANYGNIFNNKSCIIREVSENYLLDPTSYITIFDGVINNVQMTSSEFKIDVQRTLGTYEGLTPLMTYSPNCQWKQFKDVRCGYAGVETTCDRTLTRCQALGNVLNFGGHPSIVELMVVK